MTTGRIAEWLPPDCLGSRSAVQPFESVVQAWADEWFHSSPWGVVGAWAWAHTTASASWSTLRASPNGFTITSDDGATLQLALDMLGAAEQARYTEADLRLLRRLAGKSLDDLDARLSTLPRLAVTEAGADQQWVQLLIGHPHRPYLAISCVMSRLVPVVRANLPRMHKPAKLSNPLKACDEQVLDVSALLGRARLSIADITQFETGDIVMLDMPSAQPVTLAVFDRATGIKGHLGEQDGHIIFEVTELK